MWIWSIEVVAKGSDSLTWSGESFETACSPWERLSATSSHQVSDFCLHRFNEQIHLCPMRLIAAVLVYSAGSRPE